MMIARHYIPNINKLVYTSVSFLFAGILTGRAWSSEWSESRAATLSSIKTELEVFIKNNKKDYELFEQYMVSRIKNLESETGATESSIRFDLIVEFLSDNSDNLKKIDKISNEKFKKILLIFWYALNNCHEEIDAKIDGLADNSESNYSDIALKLVTRLKKDNESK